MNNNYDPNQQPQYEQQQYYQDPAQQQYYQQPLYEQPALDPTPFFIMAIIGLALAFNVSVAGIILSAIALSKAKAYFAQGGACEGKAKVAKILATVGLWAGVGFTVFYFLCFIIGVIIGLAGGGAAYSDYNDMPFYYY